MRQFLKKHFPFIDENVDRIGYWAGFGALVWTIMSATISSISPIAQYGWGAVVLAGLGVACIFVLVISACLVAWRYFKPLPPLQSAKAAQPPATVTANSNSQFDRDLLLLMHYTVYQSTVLMLDNLLKAAPEGIVEGPLHLGGDFALKNVASQEFVELVRRKLDPGSWRRSDFESVMHNAAAAAEYQVEQTPMEQRPSGIDPLALRKWAIAHLQCAHAIGFLQRQKAEAEENLLNQRFNLLQQYQLRNPS